MRISDDISTSLIEFNLTFIELFILTKIILTKKISKINKTLCLN